MQLRLGFTYIFTNCLRLLLLLAFRSFLLSQISSCVRLLNGFPFRVKAKAKPPTISCKGQRDLELRLQSFKDIRLGQGNSRNTRAFSQSLVSQYSGIQAHNKAEEAGSLKPETLGRRCHFMYNRFESTHCFKSYQASAGF